MSTLKEKKLKNRQAIFIVPAFHPANEPKRNRYKFGFFFTAINESLTPHAVKTQSFQVDRENDVSGSSYEIQLPPINLTCSRKEKTFRFLINLVLSFALKTLTVY